MIEIRVDITGNPQFALHNIQMLQDSSGVDLFLRDFDGRGNSGSPSLFRVSIQPLVQWYPQIFILHIALNLLEIQV